MAIFEIRNYDVWGNDKDGYEVNDTFHYGETELPEDFTDKDILTALNKEYFKSPQQLRNIEIGGDDIIITVNQRSNSKPVCELVKIE